MKLKQQHPITRTVRWIVWCVLIWGTSGQTGVAGEAYEIEISKTDRQLRVIAGDRAIRAFHIAAGKNTRGGKRKLGDSRTPVGTYRIVDFKHDSKFHFFMQLNYPNALDAWHGYRDQVIDGLEYRQIITAIRNNHLPPQHTGMGGYIGIHGLGEVTGEKLEIHAGLNWTEGCIALKNDEINELRRYVSLGTRVVIRE